jgi:hypothetical protein
VEVGKAGKEVPLAEPVPPAVQAGTPKDPVDGTVMGDPSGGKAGVVKLVARQMGPDREKRIVSIHLQLHIPVSLGAVLYGERNREDACHGVGLPLYGQGMAEVEQSAAVGVDGQAPLHAIA